MSKKLSEELRHCLDGKGCDKCSNYQSESRLTCPTLLQKSYEVVKRYEEMFPFEVGDMVYHLCAFSSGESEIIEMKVCCVEPCGAIRNRKGVCEVWNVYAETDYTKGYFKFFDFEKTVFLTRQEAEAKLAEMEGKK